jgi:hypothetical protein
MKKSHYMMLILLVLMVPTSIFSQTRLYKPVSEVEEEYFDRSNRHVFPDDIRSGIDGFANELIVLTGIVEKYRVFEKEDYWVVDFLIKHHYYDWIEDFVGQRPIKLSPLGEGYFTVYWLFEKTADLDTVLADIEGDLFIAYGVPFDLIEFDVIRLETKYIRHVPKQYVDTSWLPYGREWLGGS